MVHKPFALHQLIPNAGLKFPGNHIILGRQDRDDAVLKGVRRAVRGGNPTRAEGRRLFADLIDHAERCLPLRSIQRHSRANYWRVLAERWEESSGVCLLAEDVRDILLAILRAERQFTGPKTDSLWFPTKVRAINEYLRVNESSSDEAAELLIEVRAPKINVFQPPPDIRVPWSSITRQQPVVPYSSAPHQPPVNTEDVMDVDQPVVQSQTVANQHTTMGIVDEESHIESQARSDPGYDGAVAQAIHNAGLQPKQESEAIIPKKKEKKPLSDAKKRKKRERQGRNRLKAGYTKPFPNPRQKRAFKRRKALEDAKLEEELQALWDATPSSEEETTSGLHNATPPAGPALSSVTAPFDNLTLRSRLLSTPHPLAASTTGTVPASQSQNFAEAGAQVENKSPFDSFFSNLTLRYVPKPNESQLGREYNAEDEDEIEQGMS